MCGWVGVFVCSHRAVCLSVLRNFQVMRGKVKFDYIVIWYSVGFYKHVRACLCVLVSVWVGVYVATYVLIVESCCDMAGGTEWLNIWLTNSAKREWGQYNGEFSKEVVSDAIGVSWKVYMNKMEVRNISICLWMSRCSRV